MEDLLDLIGAVANGFQEKLRGLAARDASGLAPFPARLVALVGRHPGCSQQQLAAWTGRDKAQVARALKDLEARGLVGRASHDADWRSYSVSLLPEGREVFARLAGLRLQAGADLLAGSSEAEREVLRQVFAKMRARLADVPEAASGTVPAERA